MDVGYKQNRYIFLYNVLTKLKNKFPKIGIISPSEYDYFAVKELAKKQNIAKGFTLCTPKFKLYGCIDENPFFQRDVSLYRKKPCKSYVVGKNGAGDNGYSNSGTSVFSLGTSLMNITEDDNGKIIYTPLTEDELYEHLRMSLIDTLANY